MTMTWIKLTERPEQRLPMPFDGRKSFWEIREGRIVHQNRVNRTADVDSFEVLPDGTARDKTSKFRGKNRI